MIGGRTLAWPAAIVVGGAAVVASVSLAIAAGATREVDLAATRAFQSVASFPLDVVANAHTFVALWPVSAAMAFALAAIAWRRWGIRAAIAPLLIGAVVAIELALKLLLDHPGPPPELVRAFGEPPTPRLHTPSSFPSGHMARIAFFAMLGGAWLRVGAVGWIGLAAIVAVSAFLRVYLGDHWPSDVVGGAALGAGIGAVAAVWLSRARAYPPAP